MTGRFVGISEQKIYVSIKSQHFVLRVRRLLHEMSTDKSGDANAVAARAAEKIQKDYAYGKL